MNTPDIAKEYELERAELVIYLPPDWDMKISNSNYDWVIKNLKMIGRIPIEENSWIGWGHTISHDLNRRNLCEEKNNEIVSEEIEIEI